MGLLFQTVSIVLLSVVIFFVVKDIPFDPHIEAWNPPPHVHVDFVPLKPQFFTYLAEEKLFGPETVAVHPVTGLLYAAVEGGNIATIDRKSGKVEHFYVGGRPLGLAVDNSGENLIVADALKGLLSVNLTNKQITILSHGPVAGQPINFCDDVAIASNGDIYFSDATKFPPAQTNSGEWDIITPSVIDLVSSVPSGRLLKYSAGTKTTEVLLDKLQFANGVALSEDEDFVLVCETGQFRVWRHWLKGAKAGTSEVFVDLPGCPDGISRHSDGSFLVAIVNQRLEALEALQPYPFLKKLLLKLPKSLQPQLEHITMFGRISKDGELKEFYKMEGMASVTAVTEDNGVFILGSLTSPYVMTYSEFKNPK